MSTITLPLNLKIGTFAWDVLTFEQEEMSDANGESASRITSPPRWMASITSNEDMDLDEASRWEAMILSLRGDNVLAVYDIVRYNPRGTMRGTPTLTSTLAVGATSATLSSASGTLKQGDWLQIGTGLGTSQLIKVAADAEAAAGSITFSFNNPIRKSIAAAATIVWDRPVAYFRNRSKRSSLGSYSNETLGQGGFTLELVERFG